MLARQQVAGQGAGPQAQDGDLLGWPCSLPQCFEQVPDRPAAMKIGHRLVAHVAERLGDRDAADGGLPGVGGGEQGGDSGARRPLQGRVARRTLQAMNRGAMRQGMEMTETLVMKVVPELDLVYREEAALLVQGIRRVQAQRRSSQQGADPQGEPDRPARQAVTQGHQGNVGQEQGDLLAHGRSIIRRHPQPGDDVAEFHLVEWRQHDHAQRDHAQRQRQADVQPAFTAFPIVPLSDMTNQQGDQTQEQQPGQGLRLPAVSMSGQIDIAAQQQVQEVQAAQAEDGNQAAAGPFLVGVGQERRRAEARYCEHQRILGDRVEQQRG